MWIIVLPMFILLAITPMLLLSEDLLTESQQQSAAQIARMVQIQHRAVVDYCGENPSSCNGDIGYASFKPYLDRVNRDGELFLNSAGMISYGSMNGDVIVTVLSNEKAIAQMRLPPVGMIQHAWAEQDVVGAGLYNKTAENMIDINGHIFNIDPAASDNQDHNAPMIVCMKQSQSPTAC